MIGRAFKLLAPVALLCAAPTASALEVCVDDQAKLAHPARASLHRELEFLLTRERVRLRWGDCQSHEVRLSVERRRAGLPSDALGVATRQKGAIVPHLAVFVEPVIEHTGAGDWSTVGRALARVAAHEVRHFLQQNGQHTSHGLMQAAFRPQQLRGNDPRPFLR